VPRRGREAYISPPLVAVEPRSDRASAWRFRIGFGLVLIAILVGVFFLYRALTGGPGEGSPGLNPQGAVSVRLG
jgi:hypothetical protein